LKCLIGTVAAEVGLSAPRDPVPTFISGSAYQGAVQLAGVKHGDVNKHNFLVRDDGRVVLLDFETATKDVSRDELEAEYQRLTESLQDPSLRGAVRPAAALNDPMGL
jgi:hypothetical protein